MPLRPWNSVPYLPILGLRPWDMRALEELPDQTKDAMLPLVPLRPWVGSQRLQSSLDRIAISYGARPVAIELGEREPHKQRPVFDELERLRDPEGGFAAWCGFLERNENFVPVVQIGAADQEPAQIERLHGLRRGVVIRVERPAFGVASLVAERAAAATDGGEDVCFVLDFCAVRGDHLGAAAMTVGLIGAVRERLPAATLAVSASSFPSSFNNVHEQPIFERALFEQVKGQIGGDGLIYSDRGSARAEPLGGGGGVIPARIDYPGFDDWTFFRSDEAGMPGYVDEAQNLVGDPLWNGNLRVWGTQMIERTARGDVSAIDTPGKSTAARINLHLQLQTYYDDRAGVDDTEDDWED